jgi:hypothetical protein
VRLSPIEDRLGDIGGEIAEADELSVDCLKASLASVHAA